MFSPYLFYLLISLVCCLATLLYKSGTSSYGYWEKRGVPCNRPKWPFVGHSAFVLFSRIPFTKITREMYNAFPDSPFFGIFQFTRPALVIRDPDLIQSILIKDFSFFYNRSSETFQNTHEFNRNLGNTTNEAWKNLRHKIAPIFTTVKLKAMMEMTKNRCASLVKNIASENLNEPKDLFDLVNRHTTDVIAACSLGLNLDTVHRDNSPLFDLVKLFSRPHLISNFLFFFSLKFKSLGGILSRCTETAVLGDAFKRAIHEMIRYREENKLKSHDFLHSLNELKNNDKQLVKEGRLKENDPGIIDESLIVANSFEFLSAGVGTTTVTTSFLLYELALNENLQEQLYEEIITILKKHDNQITTGSVKEMTFLRQTIHEALRKYPPVIVIRRTVTKEYQVPNSDVTLPVGMPVFIPVYPIHQDPQYFDSPETYSPDRFGNENLFDIKKGTFLPFGDGPRSCIAVRFAISLIGVTVVNILLKFRLSKCDKSEYPVSHLENVMSITAKHGLWVRFETRT